VDNNAAQANPFTLIDAGRPIDVPATIAADRVWLSGETVKGALGWELKPEGLCRGEICVPLHALSAVVGANGIDLEGLAAALGRPLALDLAERAAYLGVAAPDRGAALATLQAPDFTLPDLGGRPHSLSEHRGKKVLLVAYASW